MYLAEQYIACEFQEVSTVLAGFISLIYIILLFSICRAMNCVLHTSYVHVIFSIFIINCYSIYFQGYYFVIVDM